MMPVSLPPASIGQLRELFTAEVRHSDALAQFNHANATAKMKKQALKQLAQTTPPCWIEPTLFIAGGGVITLGRFVFINHNASLIADADVQLGEGVFIGPNVVIASTSAVINEQVYEAAAITIGNNVWIGANAIIGPGVTIGENAIVGAGAVVCSDVPEGMVVAGSPACVLSPIKMNE